LTFEEGFWEAHFFFFVFEVHVSGGGLMLVLENFPIDR
jgi:hypothetical protein